MSKKSKVYEYLGSVLGILGAVLVAINIEESKYGFILFLLSSIVLMIFSKMQRLSGLFIMQFVFMGINAIGIYRWF